MKKLYKVMTVALVGALAVGCNDLDTEPLGGTITSEQKENVLKNDPSMAEAGVNALPSNMHLYQYNADLYGQERLDNDFGILGINLGLDSRGIDMVCINANYNWFSAPASLKDWGGTYYANLIYWNTNYVQIQSANTVAATIDPETENSQLQYFLGQALAFRALSYYYLVNMYQQSYCVNPDAPCVPIITNDNMLSAATEGNPRATVAQVWQQVIDDCTRAIELFEKAEQAGVTRPDKRYANSTSMYALRARAHLTTLKYSEAASDADKAISLCQAEGITPYSTTEASVPSFYKLTNHNYIWGVQNSSSDGYTQGVINFASHMGVWMTNGYNTVGCGKRISKKLYAAIPATDSRKNWWCNENGELPAKLPANYRAAIPGLEEAGQTIVPYLQMKFAAADNDPIGNANSGATDLPLMRVEEMYYIKAEAEGMQNPATGVATLNSFVKTYRNPSYNCTATSKDDFREAIWMQRRIEFWGEGLSYFDLMRFEKGIDRRGAGFDAAWVFVIEPTDPIMRYQITQEEAQTNPLIGDVEEGLTWTTPNPVTDTAQ